MTRIGLLLCLPLLGFTTFQATQATATPHDVRMVLVETEDGTRFASEVVPGIEDDEGGTEAITGRDGMINWQRTYIDAIYLTAELSGPAGVIAAGTYLNPPKQVEVVPIVGDGTPDWTFSGTEFYTASSRDASITAGVDYDAATLTCTVYRWDLSSSTPLWSYPITPASRGSYRTIAVSGDGSTIAVLVSMQEGSPAARLYLFDPASNIPIGIYDGPAGFARNLSIGEDGRFTAFIGLSTAYVVDRDAGAIRWSGNMGATNDPIAISTDGSYLAFGWTSLSMRQWNGTAYTSLWSLPGSGYSLKSCSFSADGNTFAAGWYPSDWLRNRIQLFDMPASSPLWTYHYTQATGSYQDIPYDLSLTADGRFLAVGSWGDINNTNPEVHLFEHSGPVPVMTVDTPGSVFDIDLMTDGAGGAFIAACGKHIHANQNGRGGDLFSIHYQAPLSVEEGVPTVFLPEVHVPNPYRVGTPITFSSTEAMRLVASIYAPDGMHVRALGDRFLQAGRTSLSWDGRDDQGRTVSSGVYFIRLGTGHYGTSERIVLLR